MRIAGHVGPRAALRAPLVEPRPGTVGMTEQCQSGQQRNLILLRAGDASLHRTFLVGSAAPRTWDLHISYYGSVGAPVAVEGEGFTWSTDGGRSKFNGLSACLEKAVFSVDAYDYVAIPDDDLICTKDDWNAGFALAREFGLAACQLSLHPHSFYSHDITLRRNGLRLRWVTMIESMAPIIRTDIFKQLMPTLALPDNVWGIDCILAELLKDQPKSFAILDAVSVLHTRAVGSGPTYDMFREAGVSPGEVRAKFLRTHGVPRHEFRLLGAIDSAGREVASLRPLERERIWAKALKRYRHKHRITTINAGDRIGVREVLPLSIDFVQMTLQACFDYVKGLLMRTLRSHRDYIRRFHPNVFWIERFLYRWSGVRSIRHWLAR